MKAWPIHKWQIDEADMTVDGFRAVLRFWRLRYVRQVAGGEIWMDNDEYFHHIRTLTLMSNAERRDYLNQLALTLGEMIPERVAV